jgi:hypothetical protein
MFSRRLEVLLLEEAEIDFDDWWAGKNASGMVLNDEVKR